MWKNAKGETIKISNMSDSYLLNAIHFVQRGAKDGLTVRFGGGFDMYDIWYDDETIYGKEVLERFEGYEDLLSEAIKRNLI